MQFLSLINPYKYTLIFNRQKNFSNFKLNFKNLEGNVKNTLHRKFKTLFLKMNKKSLRSKIRVCSHIRQLEIKGMRVKDRVRT